LAAFAFSCRGCFTGLLANISSPKAMQCLMTASHPRMGNAGTRPISTTHTYIYLLTSFAQGDIFRISSTSLDAWTSADRRYVVEDGSRKVVLVASATSPGAPGSAVSARRQKTRSISWRPTSRRAWQTAGSACGSPQSLSSKGMPAESWRGPGLTSPDTCSGCILQHRTQRERRRGGGRREDSTHR
jgi:hypothetical protein